MKEKEVTVTSGTIEQGYLLKLATWEGFSVKASKQERRAFERLQDEQPRLFGNSGDTNNVFGVNGDLSPEQAAFVERWMQAGFLAMKLDIPDGCYAMRAVNPPRWKVYQHGVNGPQAERPYTVKDMSWR